MLKRKVETEAVNHDVVGQAVNEAGARGVPDVGGDRGDKDLDDHAVGPHEDPLPTLPKGPA